MLESTNIPMHPPSKSRVDSISGHPDATKLLTRHIATRLSAEMHDTQTCSFVSRMQSRYFAIYGSSLESILAYSKFFKLPVFPHFDDSCEIDCANKCT